MRATWRWFGPDDPMRIDDVMQTGATSVEATLSRPVGEGWPDEAIAAMRARIARTEAGGPSGLAWDTLGGIPIHDEIKLGGPDRARHVAAFRRTVRRLAAHGVRRILFTVMPLLDWVRTDLAVPLPSGVEALGFDVLDFAVFDVHLIGRPGALDGYDPALHDRIAQRHAEMPEARRQALVAMLARGLPGGPRFYEAAEFHALLARYGSLATETYRANLVDFLGEVARVCEDEGAVLGIHPDDPPIPLCGLPRIASTLEDFRRIFDGCGSAAVGMIFCAGSLAARQGNDLDAILDALGARVVYAHPRTIRRTDALGSFREAEHLDPEAEVDLCHILARLIAEERRRAGHPAPRSEIPYRADHSVRMLDDKGRADFVPGYTPIGLVRSTAELRGMVRALERRPLADA